MLCKKILPISISAVTMACMATVPSVTVSALYQDDQGNQWWSVDELLQYGGQIDAEEDALCGDDSGCREELFFSKLDAGDHKYESLDMFRQQQFWVTSINPEAEKLDMIYFDQDPMLKRMGIEERDPLRYVYIAWSLQGKSDIGNINPDLPLESQLDLNDAQIVYAGDSTQFGPEGFPSNQVFALPINNTSLSSNTRGHLLANTYGYDFYNASTGINYSSCLNSPDYISGESCDLMFSAGQGSRYFPHNLVNRISTTTEVDTQSDLSQDGSSGEQPSEASSSSPSSLSIVSTSESKASSTQPGEATTHKAMATSDNVTTPAVSSASISTATNDQTSTTVDSTTEPNQQSDGTLEITSSAAESNNTQPLAESIDLPKTGDLRGKCEREIIFPWWLLILLMIGDAIIMWFFWPKNRKKVEKNS